MTIRTELNPYLETLGLLYLSTHPEKAREMGENARKLGEKRFNLEIFSKEIAQRLLHISTKNS